MKFKLTISVRTTLQKKKEYDFSEITTEENIKLGMTATGKNPHFVHRGVLECFALYNENGKLVISYMHSIGSFREI